MQDKEIKEKSVSVWATRMTTMSSFGDAKSECFEDNEVWQQLNNVSPTSENCVIYIYMYEEKPEVQRPPWFTEEEGVDEEQ